MSTSSPRQVNYDAIAHLYDAQPYRDKQPDAALLDPYRSHPPGAILDLCCALATQIIANCPHLPGTLMVGLDLSHGMLHQAHTKSQAIHWVQADSTAPPFANHSFDYISHQFAFHHIHDKPRAARAIFRLLRPGGRLVMTNLHPHTMRSWLYYRYFPTALGRDLHDFLHDFLPHDALAALMRQAGFHPVTTNLRRPPPLLPPHHSSRHLLATPHPLRCLAQNLRHAPVPHPVPTQITLLTLMAHKP